MFLLQFSKALTFRLAFSSENNLSKFIFPPEHPVVLFSNLSIHCFRHSICFMIQLYIVPHTDIIGRCPWIVVDFSNWGNNVVFMTCWCPHCAPWRLQQKRPGDPEFMAVLEASSYLSLVPFHFGIQARFANVQVMFICSYISDLSSWQLVQLDKDLQLVPYIQCFFVRRAGYSDLDSWWLTTFPWHCALIIRKSTIMKIPRKMGWWSKGFI